MQWLRNARLGTRLVAGFMAVVLGGAGVAGVGMFGLRQMNEANDQLYQRELLGISYVKEANINLIYAARARLSFSLATSEAERNAAKASLEEAIAGTKDWLEKAKPLFLLPEGQALVATVEASLATWEPLVHAYVRLAESAPHAAADEQLMQADKAVRVANQVVDDQLTDLTRLKEELGRKAADLSAALYARLSTVMLLLTTLSAAMGVAIGVILTRSLTRQLGGEPQDVAAVANAIAQGDLGTPIDDSRARPGSVVRAMQEMQQSLRSLVSQVRLSSESIATASGQIAMGNADLSQRTEEQASNLQQTAASMEQLAGTVRSNADTALQAAELAGAASGVAAQGGQVVQQVVSTMGDISASSKKIADIIGVIDGIAFQTNILALNAAVEAARAGEQGRGFAVVAGEVRTLAQRSALAAKEIKALIGNSVEKVSEGSRLVDAAGQTMHDIVSRVQRVNDLIHAMSGATQEQSTGIGQVTTAVNQLDLVTQQNAALVEESAAAADSLSQQADQLVKAVSVFRIDTAVH
jgi:methyl-accepting chemotaxis protein